MYQWGKLLKGAVWIEETQTGILARRFTKKQLAFYASVSQASYVRAAGCAGIRMDFITEAPEISFAYETTAFCRDSLYLDIYENGVLCGVIKEPDKSPNGRVSYQKHASGKTRITIYFPYTCDVALQDVSLGEIEYVPDEKTNYLALGDSITQGMDAKNPSFHYPAVLARYFGWNYLNHGVGGFYFDPDSLDAELPFKPDVITVAYGANDCHLISVGEKTYEGVKKSAKAFLDKLIALYSQACVYVITPIWRAAEYENADIASGMQRIRSFIKKEAASRGLNVIDGEKLVSHDSGFFGDKVLHPNEIGFMEYAMHMIPQIKQIAGR
ncbi:SGNH/GDSL hydrolase family protein [Acetivibrio sp. MSJd-27]|uniref:SGNH/GDSL hydrolase family protein n=1 Tax=Acetivibrio sp. MSJd-27 TaxID=2841523 RepID=UPI001C10AA09|nr:SGNH/GDSL hydrolase family protein [Acetivibrio sp. MSJd-27]MBU5451488.1 SGNH/GDSL hydrolase family protein [Acetivibrio sp. MSJd-27]